MNDDLRLSVEDEPGPEISQAVLGALREYNVRFAGESGYRRFGVFLRDAEGAVLGGLVAATYWNWLFVEILWLDERLRGGGHGRALLRAAEDEAVIRGCRSAYLDTFDWQARPFYERNGYEVFGTLEDFPPGHARYFLRKQLVADSPETPRTR